MSPCFYHKTNTGKIYTRYKKNEFFAEHQHLTNYSMSPGPHHRKKDYYSVYSSQQRKFFKNFCL